MTKSTLFLTLTFLVFFGRVLAQENPELDPKQVIERYLEALGGKDKIKALKTVEFRDRQSFRGNSREGSTKIIRGEAILLERKMEGQSMRAIVNGADGVNTTPEGVFSMPPNQVSRYQEECQIVPELKYLEQGYQMTYKGIYNLEDSIQCHEIAIRLPDSSMIFKEYNVETGLLEMKMAGRERSRILEYKEFDGLLFPALCMENGTRVERQEVILNPELSSEAFQWNSEKHLALIGRWEAEMPANDFGQKQINYVELRADRSGKNGIAMLVDGKLQEPPFLNFNIVGWEVEEQGIKLQYYDPSARRLHHQIWFIQEKGDTKIVGYISDPELDAQFGGETKPIILEYRKVGQ